MAPGGAEKRRAISRVLAVAALAAAAAAIVLAATGGFTVRPYGIRVSAHGALRPALLAALFAGLAIRVLPRIRQAQLVARAGQLAHWWLPATAMLAAAGVLAVTVVFGSRAAGGSDAYGYVSEAGLWLHGDLHVHQDFVAQVPWPNADWTFTPLGYRPAGDHVLVPTYAPGVPLLMALLSVAFGPCGPYLLNPLCAALLVMLAYGLGARVSGAPAGAIAAVLVASSPALLFASMWPMSDVPAAAFWTLALVLACGDGRRAAAASGITAGIAIAIRPNLAPLALFPFLMLAWPLRRAPRRAVTIALVFGIACMPFVLFIAGVNSSLYGSPFESGYGKALDIFDIANTTANLVRYPRWLFETQGPLVFVFPFAVMIPGPAVASRWRRGLLLTFAAAVWTCYLWYEPFDAWWYLRFVLPAFPIIFVLAGHVAWNATTRLGTRGRIAAAVMFTCMMANYGIAQARERGAFAIGAGEQKYADVGRYVASQLPANAIVFTVQHSGSIRHYSSRRTIQWQSLSSDWLDGAIAYLRTAGFEPYIVLEEWEIAPFRDRFASQARVKVLDRAPRAVHSRRVYVYETGERAGERATENIPATAGCK
jgi:hypothetical protein